jgi:hypothetical protein
MVQPTAGTTKQSAKKPLMRFRQKMAEQIEAAKE